MAETKTDKSDTPQTGGPPEAEPEPEPETKPAKEIGGRGGLDPTRYGDWEKGGRAVDF